MRDWVSVLALLFWAGLSRVSSLGAVQGGKDRLAKDFGRDQARKRSGIRIRVGAWRAMICMIERDRVECLGMSRRDRRIN